MLDSLLQKQNRTIAINMSRKSDQVAAASGHPRLRLTLRQLEVFAAMARSGSTRGAADQIARSQSAASASLAELEHTLGVQLFDRVRQRLVLNENGRSLLARAAALLDQAAEVEQLFIREHATPLRMAASLTIGELLLPELVARWTRLHPASLVQLQIGNTSEVIAAVAAFDVDLGFIEGPQTHPELLVKPWLTDEMVVVAAAGHELALRRHVDADALRAARWAMREGGSGSRAAVDRWLFEHLGPVDVGFEFGSSEAIKRLVATGAAVACMSRHAVAAQLADGTLVELQTGLPPAERRLAIVLHKDKHLGRGTDDFLRHCGAVDRAEGAAHRGG